MSWFLQFLKLHRNLEPKHQHRPCVIPLKMTHMGVFFKSSVPIVWTLSTSPMVKVWFIKGFKKQSWLLVCDRIRKVWGKEFQTLFNDPIRTSFEAYLPLNHPPGWWFGCGITSLHSCALISEKGQSLLKEPQEVACQKNISIGKWLTIQPLLFFSWQGQSLWPHHLEKYTQTDDWLQGLEYFMSCKTKEYVRCLQQDFTPQYVLQREKKKKLLQTWLSV